MLPLRCRIYFAARIHRNGSLDRKNRQARLANLLYLKALRQFVLQFSPPWFASTNCWGITYLRYKRPQIRENPS